MALKNNSKNSLICYLNALTKQEWKDFYKFVQSPYFNKKQQLITFYELINERFPLKKELHKTDLLPVLGKQAKYPKQYTPSTKEDGLLRKLTMEFTQLLKEFIILETSKESKTIRQRHLIDFLMSRKQHQPIPKLLKREQDRSEKQDKRNLLYQHGQFILAEADFFMTILSNDQKNTSKLEYLNQTIVDYFFSATLLYYSAALNRESILQIQHSFPLANAILKYIESNQTQYSLLTRSYYKVFLLIRDQRAEQFDELKTIMLDDPRFDKTTMRQIYSHMLNFCSRSIRLGKLEYILEKHELYKTMLKLELLSSGVFFSPQHYLLIVKNALSLGHLEWTWAFLNDYKQELNATHQSQHSLVLGLYHYHNKDFTEALRCLIQINYSKDFFSILNYRILWIQIHFEEANTKTGGEAVDLALEALRQFLANDSKMSERINTSYQNFMRLTKRLLNLKLQLIQQRRITLINRIINDTKEATVLDERDWLLSKADELVDSTIEKKIPC